MNSRIINVFNTHIEIYPYYMGDCDRIEKSLSYYDEVYHKNVPIGYYLNNDRLYIPRGVNLMMLQNLLGVIPNISNRPDKSGYLKNYSMRVSPKSEIQKEAINFLLTLDKFSKYRNRSQFGLNLDTGDGKTYCMINAIITMNMKTLIIVHKTRLKTQWKEEFLTMSDIPDDEIVDITGSAIINSILSDDSPKGSIFIMNHQTIESYAKLYGWDHVKLFFEHLKIGIKVFDEAHKFFHDILMIDFFSNTYRTYYLTATFGRGAPKEIPIFKRAFTNVCRFGEETFDYEEKRKHINLIVIYYNSRPEEGTIISTGYGFSNYKFIDYALKYDHRKTLMKVLSKILEQTKNLKGKTLITSPKIETVDYIASYIEDNFGESVGCVYSKNTREENDNIIKTKNIISSTIKSIGEGDNVKGLRVLINLDPIGSRNLADQLRGRLREYSKEDDTFLFYPVDLGFLECGELFKRILPIMKRKCKSITFVKWMGI